MITTTTTLLVSDDEGRQKVVRRSSESRQKVFRKSPESRPKGRLKVYVYDVTTSMDRGLNDTFNETTLRFRLRDVDTDDDDCDVSGQLTTTTMIVQL